MPGLLAMIGLAMAGCAQAQPTTDLWTARMVVEEEVHPCLMFGPEDLPAIRERLTRRPYADWWEGVQRSTAMNAQAFTWLITGDTAKAEAAKAQLPRAYPSGYHCYGFGGEIGARRAPARA